MKKKQIFYYEAYNPIALKKITETKHKVIDFQKRNKQKELFSILTVVDRKFVRYSNILHGLFTLGRQHSMICINRRSMMLHIPFPNQKQMLKMLMICFSFALKNALKLIMSKNDHANYCNIIIYMTE